MTSTSLLRHEPLLWVRQERYARSTVRLHLVLDTNCFRGLAQADLERLAALGLPICLSDLAYGEAWSHSVAKYTSGKKDRREARGLFFARVRRVLPYLDPDEPMAFIARKGLDVLRAQLRGTVPDDHADDLARVRAHLRRAARPEFTDEEWLEGASDFAPWLDEADKLWLDYNLPEDRIWTVRYADDQALREEHRAAWNATPIAERYRDTMAFNLEGFGLSLEEAARSDAFVRLWTWRMLNNTHAFGRARRNDGADNLLAQHVSTGGILVTNDVPLLGAIEASGTRHGPWVRHFDEAIGQPLPTCFPWDPQAESVCGAFRRTSVDLALVETSRWVDVREERCPNDCDNSS